MISKTIIGFILALTFSLSSLAGVTKFTATHPTSYVVVKGDTLWDISARFLQNPWEWSNAWKHNGQIKNPHLIYPGDVISFCFVGGKPMLCVDHASSDDQHELYPHMRQNSEDDTIAMIPSEAIIPFLNSPKIVSKDELENSPYIIDFASEHIMAGAGTYIFVRTILQPDYLTYTTYRPGDTYIDPETEEILGYEAEYIGDNVIISLGDPATLRITNTQREVRKGDRLIPTLEENVVFDYFPKPPEKFIQGSIISVLNGVQEIGTYNIIVINKGARDGLEVANILTIMQKGKLISDPFHANKNELVKLPNQKTGIAMVFRVFDKVSYALVMHATRNMRVLDLVQTPEK